MGEELGRAGINNYLNAIADLLEIEKHIDEMMSYRFSDEGLFNELRELRKVVRGLRQQMVAALIGGMKNRDLWCILKHALKSQENCSEYCGKSSDEEMYAAALTTYRELWKRVIPKIMRLIEGTYEGGEE